MGNDGGTCAYESIEAEFLSIDCSPRMTHLMIWAISRDGQDFRIQRDHSVYLAENFTDFVYTPGFPYLRLHPALLLDDYPVQLSPTEEQVLLVMHSTSNNLLVVTNRNVCVYKIPRYKPFLERLGGVGVKFTLGLVPGVGQALEIADRGYVIQNGRMVIEGTGESLMESDIVKKAYLGL